MLCIPTLAWQWRMTYSKTRWEPGCAEFTIYLSVTVIPWGYHSMYVIITQHVCIWLLEWKGTQQNIIRDFLIKAYQVAEGHITLYNTTDPYVQEYHVVVCRFLQSGYSGHLLRNNRLSWKYSWNMTFIFKQQRSKVAILTLTLIHNKCIHLIYYL